LGRGWLDEMAKLMDPGSGLSLVSAFEVFLHFVSPELKVKLLGMAESIDESKINFEIWSVAHRQNGAVALGTLGGSFRSFLSHQLQLNFELGAFSDLTDHFN